MAKIAVRVLASGDGWSVEDVVCSHGPGDRPFEEQHAGVTVAIVMAGTFQYRASGAAPGRELMTPGSVLLGSPGQYYECGHEHAVGDRCVSFHYAPAYFESITTGASGRGAPRRFGLVRLPPLRALSPVIARANASLNGSDDVSWDELSVRIAAQAVQLDAGRSPSAVAVSPATIGRVTETVRLIERRAEDDVTLADLGRAAGLSPFHFLRVFEELTGVTPHQYLRRTRLRRSATRVATESTKIVDIAMDSGFGDVSNFNRAFRAEFGVSPRQYRRAR